MKEISLNIFLGITLVVFALAIAVVPNFTDCASQGHFMTVGMMQVPMACHWAGRAEIAVGAPLVSVGAMMSFTRHKTGYLTLSILGVILGAAAILLPTSIIGTCPSPTMMCNTVMKPTLTILGSLTIVGSLGGLILMRKANS